MIARDGARGYEMGVHAEVRSLVAPISADWLDPSTPFRAMSAELADSPLASKIAWSIMPRRRARLHATLGAPGSAEGWRAALHALGPFRCRIGGPFSGNINVGRIYLKLYPEERDGLNRVHAVQDAIGQPRRDMHLVGMWNLTDHLGPAEAAWLNDWLRRWSDAVVADTSIESLWVLASRDDLVLDSRVDAVIAFG